MKNFLYILLITISACSPDNDFDLLEADTSPKSPVSFNLESHNEINMMVNSSTVNCRGEMEGTCLLVQEGDIIGTENWENFYYYDRIEGFNYEAGFVYGLIVKKTNVENPPAGGSSIKYELVKIVSKEAQETTVPENATEISTVNELIAGLKSDRNLYIKAGNYILPSTLFLNDISNLQVTGADGAVFIGDLKTLIRFNGTSNRISFNNIVFNSTSKNTSEDYGPGIVEFDGSAEDILFENCVFTCPGVASNALKFAAYQDSRSKNITISKCNFYDIGRMAIETVNHHPDDVLRITDVKVTECNFQRLGLKSPFGMAVSLSGSGENAVISNNIIFDANDIGIENVAWNNVLVENNTFSSERHVYDPISMNRRAGGTQFMTDVIIIGNSGRVSGAGSHLIELNNLDGLIYKKNSFYADALHLNDVKNSSFSENFHSSDGGIGLYVENQSSNNTFTDNTLATTRDNANTIVFYPGATANTLQRNEVIKGGAGGSIYSDMDGGNINLDL